MTPAAEQDDLRRAIARRDAVLRRIRRGEDVAPEDAVTAEQAVVAAERRVRDQQQKGGR